MKTWSSISENTAAVGRLETVVEFREATNAFAVQINPSLNAQSSPVNNWKEFRFYDILVLKLTSFRC